MSQEQQDKVEQQAIHEGEDLAATPSALPAVPEKRETEETQESAGVSGKKRSRKKGRLVNAEEVIPRPSIWPIVLAAAVIVMLVGIMLHPLVIALGVVLVIAAVAGWALERQ